MSRFEPVPPPEVRAEVRASLLDKLGRAVEEAQRRAAVDNTPEALAERLAEHGWTATPPSAVHDADVRSIRIG